MTFLDKISQVAECLSFGDSRITFLLFFSSFADDVVLFASSVDSLHLGLEQFIGKCQAGGMITNVSKAEDMGLRPI